MNPSLTTLARHHRDQAQWSMEIASYFFNANPSHANCREQALMHLRFALLAIIAGASKRVRDEARKTLTEMNQGDRAA